MLISDKVNILTKLQSEDELRVELVIPLLRKMGKYTEVLDNQGANEAGVDVIASTSSPFNSPEYTAFVLKKGNITLKSDDRKNNIVTIIETQIRMASTIPLSHPRLQSDRLIATRFVVLTNGTISKNAEDVLRKSAQNLSIDFVAQDKLLKAIDDHWPEFYEDRRPFLSTYAKRLFESLDTVDLESLGYTRATKSLSGIYIDAILTERDSITDSDMLIEKDPIHGQNLCKLRKDLIVVTSGPGGGKSTLLKEIAISQSQNGNERVAVYMHARQVHSATDVYHAAASSLAHLSGSNTQDIQAEISDAKLLLIVDGLDEIASPEAREAVVRKLSASRITHGTRVIIGSRPENNPNVLAALAEYSSYAISPLRYGQIRNFFGKWFQGTDKAVKLLEAMHDKGVMDKLPRTPMTMTLVAIVFESKEDLPATLTELYEMFVELLTGKWDASRQITSAFDSQMKVAFLGYLAATLHRDRLETIDQDRAVRLAKKFFETQATLSDVDSRAFIQDIIDRSHIVVPCGDRLLRFSHMTFQEFFAADYFNANQIPEETIVTWYGEDWWKEVLFFYAGKRKNVSSIVQRLLSIDHSDPDSRLTKYVTLGSMLQAGTLTDLESKVAAIDFAARNFIDCYSDLVGAIEQVAKGRARLKYSRLLLLDFLSMYFAANFSSKFLKLPLKTVYERHASDDLEFNSRFFLSIALEKLGYRDPLMDLASDPKMIDTSMFLIGESTLAANESVKKTDKYKKLHKRKMSFRKAIKNELKPVLDNPSRKRNKRLQ